MVEFLSEYGLFLAKAVTWVVAVIVIIATITMAASRNRTDSEGQIEVKHLNEEVDMMSETLKEGIIDKNILKKERKEQKKKDKQEAKALAKKIKQGKDVSEDQKKRVFVLDFDGDIKASAVESLREEISAVLTLASSSDEVVVRLESGGGMVHSYGLASSQLQRIRDHQVPLTISVDRVAASGGYMMACIANKIIAAPFSIVGSIGVVAQLPNFHRLLKKNDIDYELLTAGEHKRTLTMFGENTDKGRQKFIEDLEDTHVLFKEFVAEQRPQVNIDEVANGDVWFGKRAIEKNLIDEICTSDEYVLNACKDADVYHISFVEKKSFQERMGLSASAVIDKVLLTWWGRFHKNRYFS